MQTKIIYVPGLGSNYNQFRKLSLRMWRLYGADAQLAPIDWYDEHDLKQKLAAVTLLIEHANNEQIVLVGESAGASLVLHLASHPKVTKVITVCGVAQPETPISSYLQKKSPALLQATRTIPNTSALKVESVYAAVDSVVGRKYSAATGAKRHKLWTVGHLTTIAACLTFLAPLMVTIAKKSKT